MSRSTIHAVVFLLALTQPGLGQPPAGGKASAGNPPAAVKQAPRREPAPRAGVPRKALGALLDQAIDVKDFQAPMTLQEAFGLIGGNLASYIGYSPLFVDEEAFLAEDPNAQDVFNTQIRFPSLPRKMTVAAVLRLVLAKVPGHNATFLMRSGMLEITTVKAASPKQLLRQRVVANFQNLPLDEALDELSEQTGLSAIVDRRTGEKARTPVTATLSNDVTLEGALRLLADMADLQLVVMDQAVYVTTPANAQRLCRAAAEQARRQRRDAPPSKGKDRPARPASKGEAK